MGIAIGFGTASQAESCRADWVVDSRENMIGSPNKRNLMKTAPYSRLRAAK